MEFVVLRGEFIETAGELELNWLGKTEDSHWLNPLGLSGRGDALLDSTGIRLHWIEIKQNPVVGEAMKTLVTMEYHEASHDSASDSQQRRFESCPTASAVRKLEQSGWDAKVLVVDGGSDDLTSKIALEHKCQFIHQQGKGRSAMRLGFVHFLRNHTMLWSCLTPMGPTSREMVKMLKKLEQADVVVGDRLRGAMDPDAMTRTNYFGNHILTWIAVALYGVP